MAEQVAKAWPRGAFWAGAGALVVALVVALVYWYLLRERDGGSDPMFQAF